MNQENLEKNIVELNLMNNKLQEIEQQLQIIDKHLTELRSTSLALQELKKTKKNTEILAQIGQNIFVKAGLEDNNEVIIDIGARVFARKSINEAEEILDKRIEEFSQVKEKISEQAQLVLNAMVELEKKIQESEK